MLGKLFHIETLDSRFASPTGEPLAYAKPSKWNTPEYYVYYGFFLTIPFLMFKSVYDVSQPSHPSFVHYEPLLSPGWIPGRKVDNSDAQYSGFRGNIPYMAVLLVLHPLLRRVYQSFTGKGAVQTTARTNASDKNVTTREAESRLQNRVSYDLGFAIIFLFALHGFSALKVFLILYINFQIAMSLPRKNAGVVTWVFNVGILFANELCRGYRFADIARLLLPSTTTAADQAMPDNWGTWIDSYGGLIPRWEVLFNFTVLRMIAFNFDYLWMKDRGVAGSASAVEKKNLDPANLPERERVNSGAHPADFTFRNYIAYVLYSPLYLTGPIINFNDYISQSRHQLPSISVRRIAPYALRFLICLLTMELVLHFLYAVAISKSNPDWAAYTPFQLSMLGYFNLHIIWLKLLLPWRFFRLWALADGVDAPENMIRCMSDNYSAAAFWRSWHRSFNRFTVRYIYVPLGGSGRGTSRARGVLNLLVVFTFVAVWHDINLRLLVWGWLIVLFVLPEIVATLLFPPGKWRARPEAYRWLCGVGAVGNILMMMAANLVGFAVGLDGLRGLVEGIVGSLGGRFFLLAACATLFVGSQVMFEWRESEKRRGIDMKC